MLRLKKDGTIDRRNHSWLGTPKHKLFANNVFSAQYELAELVKAFGIETIKAELARMELAQAAALKIKQQLDAARKKVAITRNHCRRGLGRDAERGELG